MQMTSRTPDKPERAKGPSPFVVAAGLMLFAFGLMVFQVPAPVYFLVGAIFVGSALWFAQSGRGRLGLTLGALLSGLTIGSIGVAYYVTQQRVVRNPAKAQPAVYYAAWLEVQRQRFARRLPAGQAVTLDFLPGPENRLHVVTTNVPPGKQTEMADRLRQDFTSTYPGVPFSIEMTDAAVGSRQ
jgi:hypothetical protein